MPEKAYITLKQIKDYRNQMGLGLERDRNFSASLYEVINGIVR